MREIKFRAWGAKNPLESNEKEMDYNPIIPYDWSLNDVFSDIDKVFMQYTGLKDKNGKEIYEGDVIRSIHWFGDMDESECLTEVKMPDIFILLEGGKDQGVDRSTIEVIGNIYENPELIEKP
jgi:U3 small nucleolar ribonucleoprotein component